QMIQRFALIGYAVRANGRRAERRPSPGTRVLHELRHVWVSREPFRPADGGGRAHRARARHGRAAVRRAVRRNARRDSADDVPDARDPVTGAYANRQVDIDDYDSFTTALKVLRRYRATASSVCPRPTRSARAYISAQSSAT